MPSQLNGLFKTLTWNDYLVVRQDSPPGPGQTVIAAFTDTTNALSAAPAIVPGTKNFKLADTVTVSISLDQTTSFKESWVSTLPQPDSDALLSHEQGHYDIHALLSRDFFLQVMQLKLKTYTSPVDVTTDINTAQIATVDKSPAVQKKYDDETKSGSDKIKQALWKGFISTAFSTPATQAQFAKDGTPIKITLLTVLSQNGFNF